MVAAGLRTRGNGRWSAGPISRSQLGLILRDRYYIGYVTYKGVEYKGRHEPIISERLFDTVQRVLDSHQGSGVRQRSHHHYLKGWLWCNRCGKRFVVQRTLGHRGGEYYYFFCMGRQEGACDHPYVPVEEMEKAIVSFYNSRAWLPHQFLSEVRAGVDAALSENLTLSKDLRHQHAARLEVLDNKENYLLDLAAEEGWPKEKLRTKIAAIRRERQDVESTLTCARQQLDTSRNLFYKALDLLNDPARMYAETDDETVRSLLNKAFFTRFVIDGRKVLDGELREPFDALNAVYERRQARAYHRQGQERQTAWWLLRPI